jgi:DNA repair protein RadC
MQEQFYVLLLNRVNNVIGMSEISAGGVAGTLVDPKILFEIALKANASGIILCHNHPSGNLKPSQEDLNITKKRVEGGRLLNLLVMDHLILTAHGYYSFGDEGLI